MFTFESHKIVESALCLSSPENDNQDDDEDSHDATLLHGTPSKKDFLDKIKELRKEDEDTADEDISTDHDLLAYTSTPVTEKKLEKIEEPKTIVSHSPMVIVRPNDCESARPGSL